MTPMTMEKNTMTTIDNKETTSTAAAAHDDHWSSPRIDLAADENGWRLFADLPGVLAADLELTVEERALKLQARRSDRPQSGYRRSLILPDGCDPEAITARLENGLLKVEIGSSRAARPRRIAVTA